MKTLTIRGFGVVGACLAWRLWWEKRPFLLVDDAQGSSSRVAAGLMHAVTGKHFALSWRYEEFHPCARDFYQRVEQELSRTLWHDLEVLRWVKAGQWQRLRERIRAAELRPWFLGECDSTQSRWELGLIWRGGARVDVAEFVAASWDFFLARGCVQPAGEREVESAVAVWCEGARGLMAGRPLAWSHRCAKGEILTVRAHGWQQQRAVIDSGWLVPLGNGLYKVGATYEWQDLDNEATAAARLELENLARLLGDGDFEVVAHQAGIRPIVRRSQPVVGPIDDSGTVLVCNGMGSKGTLTAPWASRALVDWWCRDVPIEPSLAAMDYLANR